MGTRIVALVAATALLALPVACGGSESSALDTAVVGTWAQPDGLVVRFTPDGKFSIDTDGSLKDGAFVNGTYTVEGSKARFIADKLGPRGCGGQTWEWEISQPESGKLEVEVLDDVCQTTAGTRWSLVKRSDS